MPIYEYRCGDCGARFEVLVYSDKTEIVCEKCGSKNAEKLISGFAGVGTAKRSSSSCGGGGRFT